MSADMLDVEFGADTPLVYLLPTLNGKGLPCYAILHYLFSAHNELLDAYRELAGSSSSNSSNSSGSSKRYSHATTPVSIESKRAELFAGADNAFLVLVGRQVDELTRLVRANCSYDAKELRFVFNYEQIESAVVDQYVRARPRCDLATLPLVEFSDELNDAAVFARLQVAIPQVNKDKINITFKTQK